MAIGMIAVFAALRLQHVPGFRVWFDEIFTLDVARRSWGDLLWYTKEYDVHPPFFYMTVKLWTAIGGWSYAWLGLYPVFWMIAVLVPFFLLARELALKPIETNVALALMAVNGYLIGYGEEIRVYSLLLFMSTSSLWLFARYCNDPRSSLRAVLALGLINFLIVYTEYFGWLVVGAEGLFLLLWNRKKLWAFTLTAFISAVLYLPWVYLVIDAAHRRVAAGQKALFYIPRPSWFSFAFFYANLNGAFDVPRTTTLGLVLFGLPIVIWAASLVRSRRPDRAAAFGWLVLFATFPVVIVFTASRVLPSAVWGQRHLIATAAPYMMLVAVAALHLRPAPLRVLVTSAMIVWATLAGVSAQRHVYKAPGWDQIVSELVQRGKSATDPTPIYALAEDEGFPIKFYLDRLQNHDFNVVVVRKDNDANRRLFGEHGMKPFWADTLPVLLVNDIRDLPGDSFWIGDDGENGDALGYDNQSFRSILTAAGFTVGSGISAEFVNRRWNSAPVHLLPVSRSRVAAAAPVGTGGSLGGNQETLR
jgi:uncharacterized membrane protein